MPTSGLVVTQVLGITVVNFRNPSMLDSADLDVAATELYALVDDQARRKLVLDFSAVRFLSSQVIGVLIQLHKKIEAIKGRMVLCGLKGDLMRIFQVMNLHKVLHFAENEEKALNSFDVFTRS